MSHFYGTLNGNRGEATRCGSKASGITTYAASWKGAVCARVYWNEEEQEDWAIVTLTQWQGAGCYPSRELYNGPVSGGEEHRAGLAKADELALHRPST